METDSVSELGAKIANQRRAIFLTQAQLADACGVTQSAVARWESGAAPALRHRRALAEALMISPAILFGEAVA